MSLPFAKTWLWFGDFDLPSKRSVCLRPPATTTQSTTAERTGLSGRPPVMTAFREILICTHPESVLPCIRSGGRYLHLGRDCGGKDARGNDATASDWQ